MGRYRIALAAAAAALALAAAPIGIAAGCPAAEADEGRPGVYFVDVRDKTNRDALERMRHAAEKARAAGVIDALAALREARAASEAAPADGPAGQAPQAPDRGQPAQPACGGGGFRSAGVLYGEDGTRFTWYSERVLPGRGLTELNANGRHVSEDGYVMDADGYIALASGSHAVGDVVETPVGAGRVYDYCPTPGTVDVYTAW